MSKFVRLGPTRSRLNGFITPLLPGVEVTTNSYTRLSDEDAETLVKEAARVGLPLIMSPANDDVIAPDAEDEN